MTVDETRQPASYAEAEAIHIRIVHQEANAYRVPGATWDDVVQEGRIGLWKALRDYDPARGIPFHAFARLCVSRQIINALKTGTRAKHRVLTDAVRAYQDDDGDDNPVVDTLPAPSRDDPGELASWRSTLQALAAWAGDALSPLERRCLAMRAGGWTYDQAAALAGCSPKAVDNAIQRGERKIAAFLRAFDAGHIPDAHPASERQEAPMSTQPQQQTSPEVQAVAAALEKLRRLHDVEAQLPDRIAAAEAEYSAACEALPFRLPTAARRRAATAPREQRAEGGPSRTLMESPITKGIFENLPASRAAIAEKTGEAPQAVASCLRNLERHRLVEQVPDTDPPIWRRPLTAVPEAATA